MTAEILLQHGNMFLQGEFFLTNPYLWLMYHLCRFPVPEPASVSGMQMNFQRGKLFLQKGKEDNVPDQKENFPGKGIPALRTGISESS